LADKAVFLDRDGTIIEEVGYLSDPEGVALVHGAAEALARLRDSGFKLIVVTNQSGIARGYFSEAEMHKVHDALDLVLASKGVKLDAYYFCPHHPSHGEVRDCTCRKPGTGMPERAAMELGVDLSSSFFVGDKSSDVELGINAGGRSVLVLTGFGSEEEMVLDAKGVGPYKVAVSLPEAADWIIKESKAS